MLSSPMTVWRYGHAADQPRPDRGGWDSRWRNPACGLTASGPASTTGRSGRAETPPARLSSSLTTTGPTAKWQEEAEKILRFWMDTGLDGIIMDAPNWYIDCGWEMTRRRITGVVSSYGNTYRQPEGAGVFFEDPSVWITEAGYNSLQNYPLSGSKTSGGIIGAMETGDPRGIEKVLRPYHDRVVEAGGGAVPLPAAVQRGREAAPFCGHGSANGQPARLPARRRAQCRCVCAAPAQAEAETSRSPAARQTEAAAHGADDKHYAFLRTAADGSERILVVMNFQSTPQTVEVDLSGVATARLVDLETGTASPRQVPFRVEVPAYGYRLYEVDRAARLS